MAIYRRLWWSRRWWGFHLLGRWEWLGWAEWWEQLEKKKKKGLVISGGCGGSLPPKPTVGGGRGLAREREVRSDLARAVTEGGSIDLWAPPEPDRLRRWKRSTGG